MDGPSIACIIMAAGASTRFGGDKLAAEIGGRSLLRRACEAVPAGRFSRVCLVTAREEGAALAREFSTTERTLKSHVLSFRIPAPIAAAPTKTEAGSPPSPPCRR